MGRSVWNANTAVDAKGTLWIAFDSLYPVGDLPEEVGPTDPGDCPGVISFDGESWRQYLPGVCVNHVAVAPDGAVWASATMGRKGESEDLSVEVPELAGLYVICPEVAPAAQPARR